MRQNFYSVTHDAHLVQRWLSVKHDIVTVLDVSFNFVTNLDVGVGAVLQTRQVNLFLIVADDVLCTWPILWSILDEFFKFIVVVWSHSLWEGEVPCDLIWNTKLV